VAPTLLCVGAMSHRWRICAAALATAVASGCIAEREIDVDVGPGEDNDDDLLGGKADGDDRPRVELKVTIDPAMIRRARSRLALRNDRSESRDIWFYDTSALALFDAGVVLRARKIIGDDDDSTVKLRPLERDDIDPRWLAVDGMKCEIDRLVDRETPSCSLTVAQDAGEIDDVADGQRDIDKLFSPEQEELLAEHGPAVPWSELSPLGPIPARVWTLRTSALPAKLGAELWYLPDGNQVLELSLKVPVDDGDDAMDALLALCDDLDLPLATDQETKTRRALELLAE
jgi:hypothetical protein